MTTTTPEIVTGYQYVTISPASGGFGEYDARNGESGDLYASASDLIDACEALAYVSTDNDGWEEDEKTELVEAIEEMKGAIHGEPDILVAIRQQTGIHPEEILVFGIAVTDCYELASGEYVSVYDYNNSPDSYTLASA